MPEERFENVDRTERIESRESLVVSVAGEYAVILRIELYKGSFGEIKLYLKTSLMVSCTYFSLCNQ